MSLGYEYAERMEAAGVLDAHFGQHRKMHWPGWRPSQVCGVTCRPRPPSFVASQLCRVRRAVKSAAAWTRQLRVDNPCVNALTPLANVK